jgi:hypothetical protein
VEGSALDPRLPIFLFFLLCNIFSAGNDFLGPANVKCKIWAFNETLEIEQQKERLHMFRERSLSVFFFLPVSFVNMAEGVTVGDAAVVDDSLVALAGIG